MNRFTRPNHTLLLRFAIALMTGFTIAGCSLQTATTTDQNSSSSPSQVAGSLNGIEHIAIFLQENHSFDNYFGRLGQYRIDHGFDGGVDDLTLDVALPDPKGKPVSPFHQQTVCVENARTGWNAAHFSVDGGKMDNFVKTVASWSPSSFDPEGTRAMGYYDWTDLPYYYELATQFATSDRYFASVLTFTVPNRMYLFASTSFGHIVANTPPATGWPNQTIFDALDQANVIWRYYVQDATLFLSQWATYARDKDKVTGIANWYTDVQHPESLPSVIFIERAGSTGLDEHPPSNIQKGAANTKKIIDGLVQSPSWSSSALIFTFDEGDGLYDHVPPASLPAPDDIPPMLQPGDQTGDFTESGQRVPFILISPWARPHYVSHAVRDHTSILKLLEKRFGLPSLTDRDAAADDMTELFDFSQPRLLTPPALPDQPLNRPCDFSLEKAPGY